MKYQAMQFIKTEKLGNNLVILNVSSNETFLLNEGATKIMELLIKECSFDEIVSNVSNYYGISQGNSITDTKDIIDEMLGYGIISEING